MGNLTSALQQLRMERKQAQSRVESIDQAISVIESLNGSGTLGTTKQPSRVISQASRRKMALAQRARWARVRNGVQRIHFSENGPGSSEAHHVSGIPQEDCCLSKGTVGENKGSA